MFLRKLRVHQDGKEHGYWSRRCVPGQRTLCYLGELNGSAHARWQKTVEVFNEHGESTQLKLFPSEVEAPDDPNVARMLVKKVRMERARRFGEWLSGTEVMEAVGLEEFFALHLDGAADVAWSQVAAVSVSDQPVMRSRQRTGRGAALVSVHGAGRSAAYRKRRNQRRTAVSLSGSSAPTEEQNRTASEATLWGVVRGGIRRAALGLDQHVCGRGRGRE